MLRDEEAEIDSGSQEQQNEETFDLSNLLDKLLSSSEYNVLSALVKTV